MTVVGICGHQRLGVAHAAVERLLTTLVETFDAPVVGLTSLAEGADQLFGRAVLSRGGTLHAVVPCLGYETTLSGKGLAEYHSLLATASEVVVLDYDMPSEAAFLAAGRRVADECEVLVAVWDGEPSRGPGGTADVVAYAHELGREVRVVWPEGVLRGG